jgi:hypothetical protein
MKGFKYHYTYWLQDEHGKAYIGVRSCNCNVYNDTYMSSSKTVLSLIKNGAKFTKTILAVWDTREDAISHEILLHDIFNVNINPNFYNKAKQRSKKFTCSTLGFTHSLETIELLKQQKSGIKHPNYGKRGKDTTAYGHRHTKEQKEKMCNFGEKNGMYSKNHSEYSKHLMRINKPDQSGEKNPFYGKKHKEESKRYGKSNHMCVRIRTNHHNAKEVNTPLGVFGCLLDAAEALNVSDQTIRNRIKSNSNKFKDYFYIGKKQ